MYYLNSKTAQVRNISVSVANGIISLVILLIAPLGLLAVIVNTALVMASTYGLLVGSDRLIMYLQRDQQVELLPRSKSTDITKSRDRSDIDR
ncbi:hypothetical protein Syn7502_02840 [Synechococcus sp. PCC 7502]|uniref:CRISPR-associated protein Csx18 n=1 Tax=Synechococcus sp. PCC 7502 TaxID=1173263 RepID=UPI00029FB9F1|nr:CRISPR-associated protein Csx18 [Synechococcus sp. PCC 7502]AFY74777.1 hypothetical protein Syn7502_02840 [Synechococcus sp. PCC 7502]